MKKSFWKDGRTTRALFSVIDDLPTQQDRVRVVELLTDPPDQVVMKALIASLRCLDRAEDRDAMLFLVRRRYCEPPTTGEPCGVEIDDETVAEARAKEGGVTVERRQS